VDDPHSRPAAGSANAQLGLLTAERAVADPPELGTETSDDVEDLSPEGHIRSDRISDDGGLSREAPVATANDPVELLREPGRPPAADPVRLDPAPHSYDVVVAIAEHELLEPVGRRNRVVVEERDHVAARGRDANVPGSGETRRLALRDHYAVEQPRGDLLEQRPVAIDDDDDLDRCMGLPEHGGDRRDEAGPTSRVMGADHDRDRQVVHAATASDSTAVTFRPTQYRCRPYRADLVRFAVT
jgi:hypothetical protein